MNDPGDLRAAAELVYVFSVAHNVYGLQTSDAIREMRQHAQMIALVDEAIDVYGRVVTNSNVNESDESAHRRGIAAVVNALRDKIASADYLPVGREAVVISRLGHRAGWYVLAWPNLDPESITCATHACPAEALVRIRIRDGE